VVTVVEGVTEVGVEGMNVGEAGEVGEHFSEALGDSLLGEFDLSHAKGVCGWHDLEKNSYDGSA